MFTIENAHLRVVAGSRGAELHSIFNKKAGLEYLWNGDPAFWAKQSPVLFPVIGALKNDGYFFNGQKYQLGRHGFARESEFSVSAHNGDALVFTLESSPATLAKYPFVFKFDIGYSLTETSLQVNYQISNTGGTPLYFSVGGHPAFRIPLVAGRSYSDYYLEFNHPEHAGRWPISKDGLIETVPVVLFNGTSRLPLTKELFQQDALVFKGLASNSVELKSDQDAHGLSFDFTGFPYLGIWAAKNADFVCIEPWCGIADSVDSDRQLVNKEGIHVLQAAKTFERTWSVTLF
ncbi:MAG: aldose 1-epimerase family protein [Bacteroidota bacterium]